MNFNNRKGSFCNNLNMSKLVYSNIKTDLERAFYGVTDATLENCVFEGPADGESALKETKNVKVLSCEFNLRYPMWHLEGGELQNIKMSSTCRAALWYDKDITIKDSEMLGIKALRECDNVVINGSKIDSAEFGWFCRNVKIQNTELTSEYPFLHTADMELDGFTLHGKYSFQYVENVVIRNSELFTKDAFWHSKNVTVYDSVIKGEYLGWYAKDLTLVRCKVIGTQPLCYVDGLKMIDCEMIDCDLSFENSTVDAVILGKVDSVKNPAGGKIVADVIGEIIMDEYVRKGTTTEIITKNTKA